MIRDRHTRPEASAGPELVNPDRLLDPLDYLAAEHSRQRAAMRPLEWLVELKRSKAWTDLARSTLAFLQIELPQHAADERDLLALLRIRCTDERLEPVAEMLKAKHDMDRAMGAEIAVAIDAAAAEKRRRLGPDFAELVRSFAAVNRRCLAWEDANVLPLARQVLDRLDLDCLAATMAARRGIAVTKRGGAVGPERGTDGGGT